MSKEKTIQDEVVELGQREANKKAAKVAFKILYNQGEEWPVELYEGHSADNRIKMHQGYLNLLTKIAKLAGVAQRPAFDV